MDENIPNGKPNLEYNFRLGVFGLAMIFMILSALVRLREPPKTVKSKPKI